MTLVLFVAVLLASVMIGIPIAFSLLVSSLGLMLYLDMMNFKLIAEVAIAGADNFTMLAVPFFIVAGEIMNTGGLAWRIVDIPLKLFGHCKGGLGYVAICATIIMASLSGAAVADTAAVAALLIPMMNKAGYPLRTSAGMIAAGGILAPIIPPSMPFIIYGVAANLSISKLFFSGIVPGLMMGIALLITWSFCCRSLKVEPTPKATFREIVATLWSSLWALMLPVIIIGGFRLGYFTPTEAGAVAAVYAFLIAKFVYRELKWNMVYGILLSAGKTVAVVLFLFASSSVTGYLITLAEIPDQLLEMLEPLIHSRTTLIIVIMLVNLLVGMVMDLPPMILIMIPILLPILNAAGVDPYYFALLFMVNGCIGLITPPVGNALNAVSGVAKVPFVQAARGVLPFLFTHLVMLSVFIAFPKLVTAPLRWFFAR
ncbi:MAG: TRAP transporter large permease subunit [Planctomycetota bacterium]|jgi:tripartite ATP-independent transporter DctM subunit|nr:TRAP transporter large permease subunit [Planctomycetota bacterium]